MTEDKIDAAANGVALRMMMARLVARSVGLAVGMAAAALAVTELFVR